MKYQKYPKTPHFPWSGSVASDDESLKGLDQFYQQDGSSKRVVVTEKLDGECTTMYHDHIHARSADGGKGVGRSWVKQLHGQIKHEIPDDWRVCGENLYAAHSIWYWDLPTFFFVFAVFDEYNRCMCWDDVRSIAAVLGLQTVPVIYEGPFDTKTIRSHWIGKSVYRTFETPKDHHPTIHPKETGGEGYVCRNVDAFAAREFAENIAKFVRSSHVQTGPHWMEMPVLPNRLRPTF